MNVEAISRAYEPTAWKSIDKLRNAANLELPHSVFGAAVGYSLPENPDDARAFLKDMADRQAEALIRRMTAALTAG